MSTTRLWSTHPEDVAALDTEALRKRFLVTNLFQAETVTWAYAHDDRLLIGGVMLSGPVTLEAPEVIKASYLLERRELGLVGLEGTEATVTADGTTFPLGKHDVLYLPLGTKDITLDGTGAVYLVSAPAHARTEAALASREEVEAVELGSLEGSNHRTIRKYIHADGIASNQLVLGITTLEPGSVWNTMPAHVHNRRTEIYLYDGLGENVLTHLMGEPDATRSLVMHDRDAVVSPPWSVHCAAGTGAYTFVWAMAGENIDYGDVVVVDPLEMR